MEFKVVLSLGIRCYTEIILKKINLKKFSSPFDALNMNNLNDIKYLLKNNIEKDNLIHTCDFENLNILNMTYGFRSAHKILNNITVINDNFYHNCLFAHHNMKEEKNIEHFKRCFQRLNIIKIKKIPTLFCFFKPSKILINFKISEILELIKDYNSKLLYLEIKKSNNIKYKILSSGENYFHILFFTNNYLNEKSIKLFEEIFINLFKIKQKDLIQYDFFHRN